MMKVIYTVLLSLLTLTIVCAGPVSAEENRKSGEVFDLGDVLIMEKGDEINAITSTDIVSGDDIEMRGNETTAEALEFIPGVDIQMGGKGQASLKLRGFDQEDVKVLIDGVPAHESYFGSLDLDQIPVDAIAKIKVIKGASSVLYGPNTMGGVINIITKKGGKKPYTSVTTSFGPNDTQNYVVNHGGSKEKVNYWITASRRTTDGFELSDDFDPNNSRTGIGTDYNEDGGTRDLSYFTKNTLNAKIGYEYDDTSKFYLSFDYHQNEKGCPTENKRYWEFTDWTQWHLSLAGEHDFTDILSVRGRVYYVDHTDTLEDISWDASHTTNKKWFEKSAYDDYTLGGEAQVYLDFGDASLLKMGASYMKDNHIQQDFYDATTMGATTLGWQPEQEYEVNIYSFGVEDEVRLFKRLTLNAGVSFDVHDPVKAYGGITRDSVETWNPQAGASFDVTQELKVYASVGKKTRFPQMKELYSTLSGGNSNLNPQETIAYEIGASKRFGSVLDFSTAVFFNDIKERITTQKVSGVTQYINKGESRIKGLEAQLNLVTPWNFDLGVGYTLLSSEDKADNASPFLKSEYVPEQKFTFDARYTFDFGLSASFQASYTKDQIEYDSSNNQVPLENFWVCNARLNQNIKLSEKFSTDLFFHVKNLFDENYEEGHGPYPGISFLLGMKLSF
ncbi:MAG: TonB-dependent receptor [Proteobacteria bacterium]|nr:TonB-dependent receptor [Pseudomonadota bacterium]MBU2627231.1 TonB-dependent receptor [Pseudomonadota bacterium]